MSTLSRTYGADNKQIVISIMYQDSGQQVNAQQAMPHMSIESGDFIQKAIKVQGFDAIYQHEQEHERPYHNDLPERQGAGYLWGWRRQRTKTLY